MTQCLVSPPLEGIYPCLFRPRVRNKGLGSERWEWSIGLQASTQEDDANTFVDFLHNEFRTLNPGLKPGKNGLPFYEARDDVGRSLGLWRFNFSRRQLRGNGSPNVPPFVEDAAGNLWPSDVLIGNGSIVKVAFTIWRWNPNGEGGPGIGLELEGVRVLQHAPYEPPPPPDYSGVFGPPETGYRLNGNEPRALPYGAQQAPADGQQQQPVAASPVSAREGFGRVPPVGPLSGVAAERVPQEQGAAWANSAMTRREVVGRPQSGWDANRGWDPSSAVSEEEVPF
jgi:hypothetical protein